MYEPLVYYFLLAVYKQKILREGNPQNLTRQVRYTRSYVHIHYSDKGPHHSPQDKEPAPRTKPHGTPVPPTKTHSLLAWVSTPTPSRPFPPPATTLNSHTPCTKADKNRGKEDGRGLSINGTTHYCCSPLQLPRRAEALHYNLQKLVNMVPFFLPWGTKILKVKKDSTLGSPGV